MFTLCIVRIFSFFSAPLQCGLAGGTPWTGDAPEEGRYITTTHAKHGMKGSDLPEMPTGTVWKAGGEAEVVWQVRFNHGGGYAYRLCPADSPLTEECFQEATLSLCVMCVVCGPRLAGS